MKTILFILLNLYIFLTYLYILYGKTHKNNALSFSHQVVGGFLLGITQIIIAELILSLLNVLYPILLLGISVILPFLTLYFLKTPFSRTLIGSFFRDYSGAFRSLFQPILASSPLIVSSIFCLLVLLWMLLNGIIGPCYSWDAIVYHLPIATNLLQNASFKNIETDMIWINVYPKNIELLMLWLLIFVKHDILVNTVQFPFVILAMISLYGIQRELNVRREVAILTSSLAVYPPIVVQQVSTCNVDIAASSLFICSIFFLFEKRINKFAPKILLGSLSLGILLGSKANGMTYILCILIMLSLLNYYGTKKICNVNLLKRIIFILCVSIMIGGYSYVNNCVNYRSPFFPLRIKIFNLTLFDGKIDFKEMVLEGNRRNRFEILLENLRERNVRTYSHFSRDGGFGPMFLILGLPGIIFGFIYYRRNYYVEYVLFSIPILLAFLTFPAYYLSRFTTYLFFYGLISFGVVIDYLKLKFGFLTSIYMLLLIILSLPPVFNNSVYIDSRDNGRDLSRLFKIKTTHEFLSQILPNFQCYRWVGRNIRKGEVLIYKGKNYIPSYPLWNGEFSNKVYWLASKTEDYQDICSFLQRAKADYFLVENDSKECVAFQEGARYLFPVFKDQNFTIFDLRRSQL